VHSKSSFDALRRAAGRASHGDQEGAVAHLRSLLRGGEASRRALGLRALAGDEVAQLALGEPPPPSELTAWVEGWAEVDQRAWICAPLVAAGLCVRLLAGWPAGEGTGRVLSLALVATAHTALDARDEPGAGGLDPRRGAELALAAATEDMDELRQLMESIQVEHGLAVLREPRALACGLAAVEAIRSALRARRGLPARPGQAVVECAEALADPDLVREELARALLATAARLERQAGRPG
jgi:hypothetical protein